MNYLVLAGRAYLLFSVVLMFSSVFKLAAQVGVKRNKNIGLKLFF